VFSGTVLLELAERGVSREQAYEWVQRNAMRAFDEQRDFKALLLADPDVRGVLSPAELEHAFDLNAQLRHVDHVFERVFQEAVVPAGVPPTPKAPARLAVAGIAREGGSRPERR
jgi:adenylosuccinate lyase